MEVWKDIKGYEGFYQVSNQGRIKSLERYVARGDSKLKVPEKIISQLPAKITIKHPRPHYTVELWDSNKRKRIPVHRIVAIAFIENPLNKAFVNHIDGNPANNNVENLEWVTCSENNKHAIDNKLRIPFSKPIKAVNPNGDIKYFESCAEAAKYFNVTHGAIRAALKGYGRSKGACGYKWEYQ
jgi:hypothetical protein